MESFLYQQFDCFVPPKLQVGQEIAN